MKKSNFVKGILSASVASIVTGCVSTEYVKQAEQNSSSADTVSKMKYEEGMNYSKKTSFIEEVEGIHVAGSMYKLSDRDSLPDFFQDTVVFNHPEAVGLQELLAAASDKLDVRVMVTSDALEYLQNNEVDSDIDPASQEAVVSSDPFVGTAEATALDQSGLTIKMEYMGSMEGLFDVVSSKANLFWKYENNRVVLFRNQTKTFILDTLAGKSTFKASVSSKSSSGGTSSTEAGSTNNNSYHETSYEATPDSPWESVKEAVEAMLSTSGKVAYSEQTGTITISDTPSVVSQASEYISEVNQILAQRIMIKTEIYDIAVEDKDDYGMDLEALYSGSSDLSFRFNSGFNSSGNFEFGLISPTSKFTGSTAFINALKKNFQTSLVSSTISYTTNGVPSPIQAINKKGYIESTTVTQNEDGDDSTEIKQGTIKTGFNMSVLPKKLSDGDIMLQMSLDISQLNELRSFTTGDGNSTIEMPDTSSKTFMQRFALRPGESVMVAGFERTEDDANTQSILGKDKWGLGGKRDGGTRKTRTIIIVTPISVAR